MEPGEEVDMPVFFFIDPEILDDPAMDKLNSIILSYTFFKTGEEEVVIKSSSASSLPTSVEVEEVNVVSKRDAKDSIGGNDGSLMNGVDCNMEGKVGKACDFDGVDDYVDAGNDNSFNLGNISIEAWVYWRDTSVLPAELEVILAKNDAYYIALDAEDKPQSKLYYGTAESSSLGIPLSVYTFPSNEWVHFFLSYDGTTTKYYINAGEMASNFHNDPLRVTSDNLMIGTLNAANYFFNGTIDEVRIYDRGLSAEEVKSIYDLTK